MTQPSQHHHVCWPLVSGASRRWVPRACVPETLCLQNLTCAPALMPYTLHPQPPEPREPREPWPCLQVGVRAPLLQGLLVPALPHPAGRGRGGQPEVPAAKVQAASQPIRTAADADRSECGGPDSLRVHKPCAGCMVGFCLDSGWTPFSAMWTS